MARDSGSTPLARGTRGRRDLFEPREKTAGVVVVVVVVVVRSGFEETNAAALEEHPRAPTADRATAEAEAGASIVVGIVSETLKWAERLSREG